MCEKNQLERVGKRTDRIQKRINGMEGKKVDKKNRKNHE